LQCFLTYFPVILQLLSPLSSPLKSLSCTFYGSLIFFLSKDLKDELW
jgi:hypothetical protein